VKVGWSKQLDISRHPDTRRVNRLETRRGAQNMERKLRYLPKNSDRCRLSRGIRFASECVRVCQKLDRLSEGNCGGNSNNGNY
jgi:hypothetical protein